MATHPFQFALNTSTIRCGEIGLIDKIEVTRRAGYDGIEPWVEEIDAYQAQGGKLDDLAKRFRDAGLQVVNLIGFFAWASGDEGERREGLAEARRCFDMARHVGCPCVAAPPWGIHEMPGLDLFAIAERYAELIDIGKECGVVPVLEFWGIAKTLGHLGEALLVASECGRTEACVLADVFHIYKSTGHFRGLRLLGPKTLGLVHVNDYPAEPPRGEINDSHRVMPGDGVAPLDQILADLKAIGFRGWLSLELFNRDYWQRPALETAQTGLAKMKAAVRKALRASSQAAACPCIAGRTRP